MNTRLLPKPALIRTGRVDHADWNYRPVLGQIQRMRYRLCLSLMERRHFGRLLVVGYGSGVFLPELSLRCDELFGVDIHPYESQVTEVLRAEGVEAVLLRESAEAMSFPDSFFDAAVAISSLEFIEDLEKATHELARVLKPEGELFVVMPASSPILDLALKLMTGESARADYGERREAVVPTLLRCFRLEARTLFPKVLAQMVVVYQATRFRNARPA